MQFEKTPKQVIKDILSVDKVYVLLVDYRFSLWMLNIISCNDYQRDHWLQLEDLAVDALTKGWIKT